MPTPHVHPAEHGSPDRGGVSPKPFLVLPADDARAGQPEDGRGQPFRSLRTLLHRWHLFSLDGPTIATLWTWLIARCAGVPLPALSLAAMFLVVWLLYAADRLLDARPLRSAQGFERELLLQHMELEPRHRFHHQHRTRFVVVLVCVTAVLGALLPSLPIAALRLDLLLGAFLAGYFVVIHALEGARLPKEVAVGLFFAAAVFIPTISRRPELRPELAVVALLFAAVCSLNCVAIYRWEHPDLSRSPPAGLRAGGGQPHAVTLWAMHHLQWIGCCLLLATIAVAFVPGAGRLDCVAIAFAVMALLLLDHGRHRFGPVTLRALADLALATPLLLWPLASHMPRR